MLKVIGNALKRRKLASQSVKAQDGPATGLEGQSATQSKLENSGNKSRGSVINADILDRSRIGSVPTPVNVLDCDIKLNRDIVFIDGGIPEIGRLLRELDPQAEIHILHQQSDGVDQIANHLTERDGLHAIHLFCEGDNGQLILGNGKLTADTITTTHSKALSRIGEALFESGEILIYGCDFSGGTKGRAAAAQLSMLTGAEVAASPEIFEESKMPNGDAPKDVDPKEEASSQANITDLSYSVPDGGLLDVTAENGLLHATGLAGGTLKSVTDGSGASVKLNEPGVQRVRTHILPNGAELTQFTNGAFTYQAEADAGSGEGELFTCLAVGCDHALAKFTLSIEAIRPSATSNQLATQADIEKRADGAANIKFPPMTEQVPDAKIHHPRRQFAGQPATELSINIPDTSAGPIAETTTMVDAPLIFLQRNKNAISISGSENDMIVVSLIAKNGTLSARPLKGAQVEGFNSVNLTISGSVKQINAALDGLRFVNSGHQRGPTELTVSAKYEKAPDELTISETVAIAVRTLDSSTEVQSVSQEEHPSCLADASKTKMLEPQAEDSGKPFIAEFTAPIGAVLTIARAGETMKLKEGDLTLNRDGTFSFSLKEGYTKSTSRVTCFVSEQGADPEYPPKIMLNLLRLPLQPEEVFAGNVFVSDIHACKVTPDQAAELIEQIRGIQSEPAEVSLETVSNSHKTQSTEEGAQVIRTSAPVVLVKQPDFVAQSKLIIDKVSAYSNSEFYKWDVEDLGGHSLHFTFDRKGRQSAVTDTMQVDQITIDTYKREQTLFLDVNSTFDPRDHGKVKSYQIELRDGSSYSDGMREIRNGFISIEASNFGQDIELNISALMQDGGERRCVVSVDGYSGIIKPISVGTATQNVFQRSPVQQGFTNGFTSA